MRQETRYGMNVLTLDIIYYYTGTMAGAVTYPDVLEEAVIDPATNKGTYKLVGRFDGRLRGRGLAAVEVHDEGTVDLSTTPPSWQGTWRLQRITGTIRGEVLFDSPTEFKVRGTYEF